MSFERRRSALANAASKRAAKIYEVDLKALVRVYLLDGSSKVLQMTEKSTAEDVLNQLKFNLDLLDISTFALFRVQKQNIRIVHLHERIKDTLSDTVSSSASSSSDGEVKLLFRSWIFVKNGLHESSVSQHGCRIKQSSTALWLTYMEATFMTMTGKYYLTEDESVQLGCLKMQAESGDVRPEVHTPDNIRHRILTRFPSPIRERMEFLVAGANRDKKLRQEAEDLTKRVLCLYARLAGKRKLEAQIEFMQTLQIWCPFYGATFFPVQCQYDDSPLDAESQPPVIPMSAAVGPLAIFLITNTEPPVTIRHSYKRIVKWVAHKENHIFSYWVLKPEIRTKDVEDAKVATAERGESMDSFDSSVYCDCIYLVLPRVLEMEHLVHSYVELLKTGELPKLQNCKNDDLLPVPMDDEDRGWAGNFSAAAGSTAGGGGSEIATNSSTAKQNDASAATTPLGKVGRKPSRFSVLFGGLGGSQNDENASSSLTPSVSDSSASPAARSNVKVGMTRGSRRVSIVSGSGIDMESDDEGERYGDDTAAVATSLFKSMYRTRNAKPNSGGDKPGSGEAAEEVYVPPPVRMAATMSELKQLAEDNAFSDDEETEGSGSGSDDDNSNNNEIKGIAKSKSTINSPTASSQSQQTSSLPTVGTAAIVSRRRNSNKSSENDDKSRAEKETKVSVEQEKKAKPPPAATIPAASPDISRDSESSGGAGSDDDDDLNSEEDNLCKDDGKDDAAEGSKQTTSKIKRASMFLFGR